MTYREKLAQEHPELRATSIMSVGCPHDFGYEAKGRCPNNEGEVRSCRECWGRDIPEKTDEPVKKIEYVKVHMKRNDVLESPKESFFELIRKAQIEAFKEGIKANTIFINKNMVKVDAFPFSGVGGLGRRFAPTMFCGMNVFLTKDELPDGYSFAVLEGPENRLAQFESIGMEPDELRKAAELYKTIKEIYK